jgi:tRNA(fMet)-specific endonuclease VapC
MKEPLLDTDIISFFLKGVPQVKGQFEVTFEHYGYFNLSIMSYYEIMSGLKFKDAKKQMLVFEELLQVCRVLPLNLDIALLASEIFAELRRNNQMIGHSDVLIGATALHHNLKMVTNNQAHFTRIPHLEIENWA